MKNVRSTPSYLLRAAIAAVLGTCLAPFAMAQDQATTPPADENIDEVVVTGTRVATRTQYESLSPVDVLPAATLQKQGTTELAEALATAAPSLDFPRPSITDGTDHIRPATLRGLAPDQTLVLVNSKRRHQSALVNVNGSVGRGSAAVDLNAIPLAAIASVEVLRDGASAQYGSDAIAGVINLRLREAREGGDASITYGQYDTEVETERGKRHADDGATLTASGWVGLPLGAEGFLTLSAEYRDRDPTSRGDFDNRVPGSPVTSRYGDGEMRDLTGYVNAGIPLENDWQIYGWAGYQNREGNSAAFPRIFNDARNVPAIYPDGFLPLITTDIDDVAAGWGVKGKLGEWDADVSLVYGMNDVHYGVDHSLNTSYGAASQTSFDAGSMKYDQFVFNSGIVRGFDVGNLPEPLNLALGVEARREGYSIEAGEAASYDRGPIVGAPAGAQGFPGFQPANELDKHRTAYSAYADLEARLTRQFLASIAVRGEHYSDFGSAVTGKVAARFDFTGSFALRGNVSTGFRAPGLQQEFFTSTATNFINGVPFEVGTFPATSAVAVTLGAKPLDAEESTNYSLGMVFRFGGFEATIDGYRIDIDDRIVLSENLNTPQVAALIAPFGANVARFFINGVDTKTEGIDVVAKYVLNTGLGHFDFVAAGNWNSTEVESLPSTNVIDNICNGQPPGCTPPVLFGRVNTLTFEDGTPDSKINLGIDWGILAGSVDWGVNLKGTRYGEVIEPGTPTQAEIDAGIPNSRDLPIQPDWVIDLSLSAQLLDNKLQMVLGADNLFDQYPDRVPNNRVLPNPPGGTVNLNATNALGFSRYSPYGFSGRFLYARLSYHW
jgi:iron complex outermembrane receptor protein